MAGTVSVDQGIFLIAVTTLWLAGETLKILESAIIGK